MIESEKLVSLGILALRLKLPAKWLKAEALAGRLPVLRAGDRLLFDIEAVLRSLRKRAVRGEVQPCA